VVTFAARRGITVIPEIDVPGHSQAAIAAYPELGHGGPRPEVSTKWGIHDQILNVSDTALRFLREVLAEVMDVFPGTFIHLGGDEVPTRRWAECPIARERMRSAGLENPGELRRWLLEQLAQFLADHDRRMLCWDDVLDDVPEGRVLNEFISGTAVMSWLGIERGIKAAQAGIDVVMAPYDRTYLDAAQTPMEPMEPVAGYGQLLLEKVDAYDPAPCELSPEEARHILGAQCQLWTERMEDTRAVEYMAFPRACAFAETVWTPVHCRDLGDFTARLSVHAGRLAALGVNYCDVQWVHVGGWKSGEVGEAWVKKEWDVTGAIARDGLCQVVFKYSGGDHRLDVSWVELEIDGVMVARDEHRGTTGACTSENNYRIKLMEPPAGRACRLRASVRADGGSDSNGDVYLGTSIP
jgi:hexosaminidase